MDEPDQYIDFMAKYGDWVSIKKFSVGQGTKPHEVAYHLAGIRTSIDNHAYKIVGINTASLDSFATEAMKGTRRSPSALASAASKFAEPAAKQAVADSCQNKDLTPIAETYLIAKLVAAAGYDVSISQEALAKVFSDLKPPRAPGRTPGKKKAAAP